MSVFLYFLLRISLDRLLRQTTAFVNWLVARGVCQRVSVRYVKPRLTPRPPCGTPLECASVSDAVRTSTHAAFRYVETELLVFQSLHQHHQHSRTQGYWWLTSVKTRFMMFNMNFCENVQNTHLHFAVYRSSLCWWRKKMDIRFERYRPEVVNHASAYKYLPPYVGLGVRQD